MGEKSLFFLNTNHSNTYTCMLISNFMLIDSDIGDCLD